MLCTPDHDNFYLTDEELQDTPSRRDGIDAETETSLRVFGAQLVQEATILLNCPQAVAATGQVLLQRFYCQRSFKQYNVKKLTAAVTFLAIKLEEVTHIPLRSVVMVFDRLWRRKENLPPRVMELGGNEYHQLKDSIIKLEREMLRVFGFIVHCDHPHKLLISLVRVLQGDDALMAEAWKIANDSLRTTLCVRFKSEVVACGVIFYAARRLQVPLLEGVQLVDGVSNWWEAFGVTSQQLVQVVQALHQLYQRPKAEYVQPGQQPRHVTPEAAGTPTRQAAGTAAFGATAAATDATSSGGKPAGPPAPGLSNSKLGSPAMEASSLRAKAGSGQSPASKPLANGGPKAAASEGGGDKRGDDEAASKREEASAAAIGSKRARSRSRSGSRSQSRDLRGGRDASRERRASGRDSRRRSRSRSRDRAGRDRDRDRERERERQRSDRGAGDRARDRRMERGGDRPDSGRGEYRSSSHREPPPHSDHSRDRRRDYERERDRDRDSSRQQPDSRSRDRERERGRGRGASEAAGRREYSSRREDRDRDGPPAPSRQDDDGTEPRARHSSAGGGGEPGGPRAPRPATSHQSGRPASSPARGPAPMAAVMEEDELENGSEGGRAGERGGGRWAKADGMSEGRRPNGAQESEGAAGLGEDEPMFASEDEDDRFPQDTGTPHDEE